MAWIAFVNNFWKTFNLDKISILPLLHLPTPFVIINHDLSQPAERVGHWKNYTSRIVLLQWLLPGNVSIGGKVKP